jgi:sec-independent protein translocase protein TatA
MGPLGTQELVFIFILALLLFGPKELPKIGKTIGKAMTEFKRAQAELKTTFDREMANIERETGVQELAATTFKTDSYTYNPYESEYYDEFGAPESHLPADGAFATQSAGSPAPLQVEAAAGSIASGTVANGSVANVPHAPETGHTAAVEEPAQAGNSHPAEHPPAETAPKPA